MRVSPYHALTYHLPQATACLVTPSTSHTCSEDGEVVPHPTFSSLAISCKLVSEKTAGSGEVPLPAISMSATLQEVLAELEIGRGGGGKSSLS